ncbi:HNH endonuclease [Agrobacterium rhizogenes]|nr:HNH endonuclease [Rhizobium rhizogenes]NTF73983.1 HNH endonuclease [Rhizobium rhizogenes]
MTYRDLDPKDLQVSYSYNPETGEITHNGRTVGHGSGRYMAVRANTFMVKSHLLAWALMTGSWPLISVDHINRDGCDNRWENLRLATPSQQQANRRVYSKSGVRGVSWYRGKWVAHVGCNGKNKYLGRFNTKEAAGAAVEKERQRIWGEFAA